MPILNEPSASAGPEVAVRPSAVVELSWILHAGLRADFRSGHEPLGAFYDAHLDLLPQVASFWVDDASGAVGYLELIVLAHAGGLLFATDLADLSDRVVEAAARPLPHLALGSESEGDRGIVRDRLIRLRRSARLRASYGALVAEVATAMEPLWRQAGRRSAEGACAVARARLARGEAWSEVAAGECDLGDLASRLVGGLGSDGTVVIAPAFFTHKGLLLDLPEMVLIGVRADPFDIRARARSDALARRLKALADPTRLAIVDLLAAGPRTVTELARAFGIAQPTVSNHVKLLREARLVTDVRVGTRRQLAVDHDTAAELLEHLGGVLVPSGPDRPPPL
jgi:DNA-binding transcriptional ArsR family regulator